MWIKIHFHSMKCIWKYRSKVRAFCSNLFIESVVGICDKECWNLIGHLIWRITQYSKSSTRKSHRHPQISNTLVHIKCGFNWLYNFGRFIQVVWSRACIGLVPPGARYVQSHYYSPCQDRPPVLKDHKIWSLNAGSLSTGVPWACSSRYSCSLPSSLGEPWR